MHANLRDHIDPVHLEKMLHINPSQQGKHSDKDRTIAHSVAVSSKEKKPINLYGSNSGTCEALVQSPARVAGARGLIVWVDILDSATGRVPKEEPVAMISSSYKGRPTDKTAHFVNWLSSLEGQRH